MKALFDQVSHRCSEITTSAYSTSFSLGIKVFDKPLRKPIYAIYGFVRFADEIVDTFHTYDKETLLNRFDEDTFRAIEDKISLNPILNSFQNVVNTYNIDHGLIHTFLKSMRMDLGNYNYDEPSLQEYILGSAEVVGLMCLKVFCDGDQSQYEELKKYAMSLGSAFQKVNFLRDLNADFKELGRSYFPEIDLNNFDQESKERVEASIEQDFNNARLGILKLPRSAKFGVYMAYVYYYSLFMKIKKTKPSKVLDARIRIPNNQKYGILLSSYVKYRLHLI
jgi:phytoene/squalene synthetase